MSNFTFKAKNRETGKIVEVDAFDNYFGSHGYGYYIESQSYLGVLKENEFDSMYEKL